MNSLDALYLKDQDAATIVLDTASNYIINFIATHSEDLVTFMNDMTHNNVAVQPWVRTLTPKPLGGNRIVSVGRDINEVHWIYFDQNMKEQNSYKLRMQKPGGHQFCQSHAIRLAFYPEARRIHRSNLEAYEGLIADIWTPIFNAFEVDPYIFEEALDTGLIPEGAPYSPESIKLAKAYLKRFTHAKLLEIMNSDRASVVAPAWG